jgi:hypothetical protein
MENKTIGKTMLDYAQDMLALNEEVAESMTMAA